MNEIVAAFNIPEDPLEIRPFGNGLINNTRLIKYPHGDYILQKINDAIFKHPESIAANIRMIGDYLKEKHPEYLFTRPIQSRKNEDLVHTREGYYRLYPYINKSHTIDTVQKPSQAYEAAKQFGQFTKMLSGFPVINLKTTIADFHNLSLRYHQFTEVLKHGNKKRIKESTRLIDFLIDNKIIVTTYEYILKSPSFKLRVTHHDSKISNVLYDEEDKGLCVIDLDTVMPGYFISDVGDMMRTYLSPANEEEKNFSAIEIREEFFTAILNGYMSEMKDELSEVEKDHFIYAGKFMIYMQALRFLTDYFNNDLYYRIDYPNQNLVRAQNQVTLLQRLMEKETKLQKIIVS